MRLIAHRGFASLHPENTLRAVREAVTLADEVEVDVRRCETGELVVIHDPTVDRVTDGSGAVAHHTLRELRDLNVLGTGEGVPTLEAVLDAVPPGVGVNIELKEVGLAHDALTLAREHHPQVTVSSFHANELEGCRGANCEIPRAYLFSEDPEQAFTFARDIDCAYLHPAADICDEWLVDRAHAEGFCVNVWTIDEQSEAERLEALGVDGVIADRWGVLPEVRQQR